MAELLRDVPADVRETTVIGAFLGWLERERGLRFDDYAALHHWSVTDLDGFWSAIWAFFGVRAGYQRVLGRREMPGAEWFPGVELNYADHAVRPDGVDPGAPALHAYSQTRTPEVITWAELDDRVARCRAGLRRLGVRRGDRVAAYLPNIPETVVAYLAAAGLGAVWASCAPEFGARAVVDRFAQIEPAVLLAVDGYRFGDKPVDRRDEVAAIRAGLPTLRHVVGVPYAGGGLADTVAWDDLLDGPGEPDCTPVPFDHPLCVLFSSGTTGLPKAIVHGHGGILVEHLKNHGLSWDLRPGDTLLWFSTTAWMMWNALVSGLLRGTALVLLDGNPAHPDLGWQWRVARETGTTTMGVSPVWLMACRRAGVEPGHLPALREVCAAGSPLPAEGYRWIEENLGVLLNVGTGGTDLCSGIAQGSEFQPEWAGEIAGPCLGVAAAAFDADGRTVLDELGELVITAPMPSMPVGFWNDLPPDDPASRYRATYFDTYPGVWRHGDWVRFAPDGRCVVAGRSDATLNRGGVRLGTADFYAVVEELPEVADSLVVHLEDAEGGNGELVLFVVVSDGGELDDALRDRLRATLRGALSPRHVPDRIVAVPTVPRNRTGKKLELPVKRILRGAAVTDVAGVDVLAVPGSLDPFVALAAARA